MTHRHIETITFGTCLVICAHTHTHTCTHTFRRRHGHCGVALPSSVGWGGGGALLLPHIFQGGGLRTTLGRGQGLKLGVWEGVLFFVSQVVFCWIFMVLDCRTPISSCRHAMQCCAVLWCVVVSQGVKWCDVVWCDVVCGGLLYCAGRVVCCGHMRCAVVCCVVMWCGRVSCDVVWCHVVWSGVMWCGVVGWGIAR